MIPTLLGAAVLVFFLLRMLPGDVCEVRLAGSGLYVDDEIIDECRDELGLNDSLPKQFVGFRRWLLHRRSGYLHVDGSAPSATR